MTVGQVRELLSAVPFRPFTIHLADGRASEVNHPEFVALAPSGRSAVVYQPDDSLNIVDLRLVTDLEVQSNGSTRRKKRK